MQVQFKSSLVVWLVCKLKHVISKRVLKLVFLLLLSAWNFISMFTLSSWLHFELQISRHALLFPSSRSHFLSPSLPHLNIEISSFLFSLPTVWLWRLIWLCGSLTHWNIVDWTTVSSGFPTKHSHTYSLTHSFHSHTHTHICHKHSHTVVMKSIEWNIRTKFALLRKKGS